MKKFRSIAAVAFVAAALAAPASAITGKNWVEDFEHPFVGLAVFYDADGEFSGAAAGR